VRRIFAQRISAGSRGEMKEAAWLYYGCKSWMSCWYRAVLAWVTPSVKSP